MTSFQLSFFENKKVIWILSKLQKPRSLFLNGGILKRNAKDVNFLKNVLCNKLWGRRTIITLIN